MGAYLQADFVVVGLVDPDVVNLEGRVTKGQRLEVDFLYEAWRLVGIQEWLH